MVSTVKKEDVLEYVCLKGKKILIAVHFTKLYDIAVRIVIFFS